MSPPLCTGAALLWPETRSCAGNGACVATGNATTTPPCACDTDWTYVGDLALDPLSPMCDIYIPAVRALWALMTASLVLALGAVAASLLVRWRRRTLRRMPRPLVAVHALVVLEAALLSPLGVAKAGDPSAWVVGRDAGATTLYCLGATATWTWILGCTYLFVALTVNERSVQVAAVAVGAAPTDGSGSARFGARPLHVLRALLPVLAVANALWCFAPMLLLAHPTWVWGVAAAHSLGLTLSMLVALSVLPFTISPLRRRITIQLREMKELGQPPNAQLAAVARKFVVFEFVAISNLSVQAAIAIPYGVWPFFIHKLSYQFPLAWTTTAVGACFFIWSATAPASSKSSTPDATANSSSKPAVSPGSVVGSFVSPRRTRAERSPLMSPGPRLGADAFVTAAPMAP